LDFFVCLAFYPYGVALESQIVFWNSKAHSENMMIFNIFPCVLNLNSYGFTSEYSWNILRMSSRMYYKESCVPPNGLGDNETNVILCMFHIFIVVPIKLITFFVLICIIERQTWKNFIIMIQKFLCHLLVLMWRVKKTHWRFKRNSQGIFLNIVSKAFKGVPQIHDLFNVDLHNNYHQPVVVIDHLI
jgi:hypothetical protein